MINWLLYVTITLRIHQSLTIHQSFTISHSPSVINHSSFALIHLISSLAITQVTISLIHSHDSSPLIHLDSPSTIHQRTLAQRSKRMASKGACSSAMAVTFATSAPRAKCPGPVKLPWGFHGEPLLNCMDERLKSSWLTWCDGE